MRPSARVDYAVRALVAMTRLPDTVAIVTLAHQLAVSDGFLGQIFIDLRRAGIVTSQRGNRGGYRLARSADRIDLRDIVLAVRHDHSADEVPSDAAALSVIELTWRAVELGLEDLLAEVSVADLADGRLPEPLAALAERATGASSASGS